MHAHASLMTDEPDRCRGAGVLDDVVHREKWRRALGLLDTLAKWQLRAPVVVADAGYGVSTAFRLGLQERGLSHVLALNGKEVAHPEDAEPHRPAYGGLGPPVLPRHRAPPRVVCVLAAQAGAERFSEVTCRQASKGAMTSRFAVLTVRPAGKQSLAAAQKAGGGRNRWDGVLPVQTLLVQWPDGQDTRTDYWIPNLPATTPASNPAAPGSHG